MSTLYEPLQERDSPKSHSREICQQTITLPEVGDVTYLLWEEILSTGEKAYAITIRCPAGKVFMDAKTVRDITTDRDLALRIFWQICRGKTTPWGLLDLIPELLP